MTYNIYSGVKWYCFQIGVIPSCQIDLFCRSEAFDEDDNSSRSAVPICDTKHDLVPSAKVNGPTAAATSPTTPASLAIMTSTEEASTALNKKQQSNNSKMISSFVTVIEGTKDLSLHEEKQRSPQRPQPRPLIKDDLVKLEGPLPVPAKCSAQFRRLLHSHSIVKPPVNGEATSAVAASSANIVASEAPEVISPTHDTKRPIYPNLPYSPYSSPVSSPRVRRKPLRETTRVNSTVQSDGEYVQLNQYKLEQAIGQVSFWNQPKSVDIFWNLFHFRALMVSWS